MIDTEIAGIVAARICHDLVSPVGAVVNGTDLIRELGRAETADELGMVEQSAQRAAAMLKFLRLAFGHTVDPAAELARDQLRARADTVLGGRRVLLEWTASDGPALQAPAARLTCLMLLAARGMLGMSGTLRVVLPASGALPVAVIAQGEKAAASADQRRWLAGGPGPVPDSRQVEFALIGPTAATAGARIELNEAEGQLALRASPR